MLTETMTPSEKVQKQIETMAKIIEMRDCEASTFISTNSDQRSLAQGQFVFTLHPYANPMLCVGYVLQVRKKAGLFGTDIVLIRVANQQIHEWENQGFFSMMPEQEALARSVFEWLPEQEDYSLGYRTCDKVHKVGFLIEEELS
ncbi:hypothetical protein [Acinetobacter baumannii]|uniref:hypothetical protein n=1 Tax=Acinetobacter baumannii TaxID=470 RepID=UPI0009A9733B|nr:hypothetical protein [Acinetobacter baumannii]